MAIERPHLLFFSESRATANQGRTEKAPDWLSEQHKDRWKHIIFDKSREPNDPWLASDPTTTNEKPPQIEIRSKKNAPIVICQLIKNQWSVVYRCSLVVLVNVTRIFFSQKMAPPAGERGSHFFLKFVGATTFSAFTPPTRRLGIHDSGEFTKLNSFFFTGLVSNLNIKENLFLFLFLRFLFQSPDRLWKPFKRRIVSTKDAVVFVVFFSVLCHR